MALVTRSSSAGARAPATVHHSCVRSRRYGPCNPDSTVLVRLAFVAGEHFAAVDRAPHPSMRTMTPGTGLEGMDFARKRFARARARRSAARKRSRGGQNGDRKAGGNGRGLRLPRSLGKQTMIHLPCCVGAASASISSRIRHLLDCPRTPSRPSPMLDASIGEVVDSIPARHSPQRTTSASLEGPHDPANVVVNSPAGAVR